MRKFSTVIGTIAISGALFAAGCDSGTEDYDPNAEPRTQMGGSQEEGARQEAMPGSQQRPAAQQPGQPSTGDPGDDPYADDPYEDEGYDEHEDATDPWQ